MLEFGVEYKGDIYHQCIACKRLLSAKESKERGKPHDCIFTPKTTHDDGTTFWVNIMKYPEMLSCKDPDCMVDYTYTFDGKTVTAKILSQEKYMNKYHRDLIKS